MTKIVNQSDFGIVCQALDNHKVVAFPTETVFGVGVKFNDVVALDALMEAKNRDYSKAVTLMVYDISDIEKYAYVNDNARKIIDNFMPGMITLVMKKKESVDPVMTNGKDTIGIRIPDSKYVLELLKRAGPMLVTSANLSNHINTTTTSQVLEQLDGRIELVVDGKTLDNVASSVIDVTSEDIKVLREGKIKEEDIRRVL